MRYPLYEALFPEVSQTHREDPLAHPRISPKDLAEACFPEDIQITHDAERPLPAKDAKGGTNGPTGHRDLGNERRHACRRSSLG